MSTNNVIPYERFCAARKAKLEKVEAELDQLDADMIDAARDFYAQREAEAAEENRYDYE